LSSCACFSGVSVVTCAAIAPCSRSSRRRERAAASSPAGAPAESACPMARSAAARSLTSSAGVGRDQQRARDLAEPGLDLRVLRIALERLAVQLERVVAGGDVSWPFFSSASARARTSSTWRESARASPPAAP
jgi:hypothetical protein